MEQSHKTTWLNENQIMGSHPPWAPWDFLYGWGEPPKFQGGWDYTQN